MNIQEWAAKEIEIACKKENPDWDGKSFDYGCACYKSAEKAYNSLLEDNHSGMSFGFTVNILSRLMNSLPLTPIEDTEDVWDAIYQTIGNEKAKYQCNRMSSLFKEVDENGNISYTDVDRDYTFDPDDEHGVTWHNGLTSRIVDELYPITMPYYPSTQKYKVASKDYLTDRLNGDYDTYEVMWVDTPNEGRVEINRYFKSGENGWEEIDKAEFDIRYLQHNLREEMEANMSEEELKEYHKGIADELHMRYIAKYGDNEDLVCCGG